MEKTHFIKMVSDAARLNGFYMDDYTAELMYDHFLDMEYDELSKVLKKILDQGEKVTYKSISQNRTKKREFVVREPEPEVIYECGNDCKTCENQKKTCTKMSLVCSEYIRKIMKKEISLEQTMKELHELYPTMGFDKKIGHPVGVLQDANGEHLTVYTYD